MIRSLINRLFSRPATMDERVKAVGARLAANAVDPTPWDHR